MHARGEVFVVSAPSGAGKTTLSRAACQRISGLAYSVSHTTRPPRAGEVNGRDYFFVSEDSFQEMVNRGEFLEWARVYRHLYGTSRSWLQDRIEEGLDVILDVDVQGAQELRKSGLPSHQIFVLPPSWQALRERLVSRGTDSPQEVVTRLEWAQDEMRAWESSDFVLVNDDLEQATKDLVALILAQRCRTERRRQWIERQWEKWTPSRG
jgi:guanylate kinase